MGRRRDRGQPLGRAADVIPRTFHRIWLDESIPERYEAFWQRLKELHPGWDFVTWNTSSNYVLGFMRCREVFDQAMTWAGKSDVLRYEVLHEYGGIYLDTDVEPLRPFDELLEDERPFAAWEDKYLLCPTVMGSPAGHPAVSDLLEALPKWARLRAGAPPNQQTGPHFLTAQWADRRDVRLLPRVAFYPVHWSQRVELGGPYPPESYAVHWWDQGWDPAAKARIDARQA